MILAVAECNGMDSVVSIVKFILKIVRWVVPIILIVLGTIDLVKAVIAGKEDEIKKHQLILVKRAIAAVLVFLVPTIVTILMGWIGTDEWKKCWNTAPDSLQGVFQSNQLN